MKKLPIIYNDQYGFIVDQEAEINIGDYKYHHVTGLQKSIVDGKYTNQNKVLAYIKLSPESPDIEGLIEVKLVDDVITISENESEKHHYAFGKQSEFYQLGFIEGYNYNRLFFPQPTWEDVEKAIEIAQKNAHHLYTEGMNSQIQILTNNDIISHLKQSKLPKEWILGEGETTEKQIHNGKYVKKII